MNWCKKCTISNHWYQNQHDPYISKLTNISVIWYISQLDFVYTWHLHHEFIDFAKRCSDTPPASKIGADHSMLPVLRALLGRWYAFYYYAKVFHCINMYVHAYLCKFTYKEVDRLEVEHDMILDYLYMYIYMYIYIYVYIIYIYIYIYI